MHEWRERLEAPDDELVVSSLRRSTIRGWPLGRVGFLGKVDWAVGHRVRPPAVGRPTTRSAKKMGDCP